MKNLLFLFSALLLISCSGDDDDNTVENQTFLEKYDGVGFYDEYGYYVFFYNDEVFRKTAEIDDGVLYCTETREGANNVDGEVFNVVILTNDLERLVVKFINNYLNEEYTETVEYIVNPTQNAMTEEWDDNRNFEGGGEQVSFFKTTTTYSSLCN